MMGPLLVSTEASQQARFTLFLGRRSINRKRPPRLADGQEPRLQEL